MARRPLPRLPRDRRTTVAWSRERARAAAPGASDALRPLVIVARGLYRLVRAARRGWAGTPRDRRGPVLFLAGSAVLIVALAPFGPLLALAAVTGAALWYGRGRPRAPRHEAGGGAGDRKLSLLYEALVPYFWHPADPDPLYTHGGAWERAFPFREFDAAGNLSRLVVRYPPSFTDGEVEARACVERLVHAKSGRGHEHHFLWDQEVNELTVTVLPPLPTGVAAQRFDTAPGETLLGFTDSTAVPWTLRVLDGSWEYDLPPVVWHAGGAGAQPHLLAAGVPGCGTTTLLRSLALQALRDGDVLIVDGGGAGAYAFLAGRAGVLAVECGLSGALSALQWVVHETRRRLVALNEARQAGVQPPEDAVRTLWVLLDRPVPLSDIAAADGRPDPQSLLQVPLRYGRTAQVTVVVAERTDALGTLAPPLWQYAHARVVLGPAPWDVIEAVLGAPPHTTPAHHVPAGRGYARSGAGPVLRLQVPSTPDPGDGGADAAHRQAVLDLLPPRVMRGADAERPPGGGAVAGGPGTAAFGHLP